jgi:hypothetical protein
LAARLSSDPDRQAAYLVVNPVLDFTGQRIATPAEPAAASIRRPVVCNSARDQYALEFLPAGFRRAFAARQRFGERMIERLVPIGAGTAGARRGRNLNFRRQVACLDDLPRRHDSQPMTDVLKLPDVTRKLEAHQRGERGIG